MKEPNGLHVNNILFRIANITPTKSGQFVTLWKRIGNGPIIPYDMSDPIDYFMIYVQQENRHGFFFIPKTVLYTKGFVSSNGQGGKRAMRVYASWDIAESKQAQKTQEWQLNYFFELDKNKS